MLNSLVLKIKKRKLDQELENSLDKENPLYNLEKHAVNSNYDLRKRNDIEIGRYTYGRPIVRSGCGIAKLKIGKFCEFGPDISIHLVSDHHPEYITPYDLDALCTKRNITGYLKKDLVYKGDVVIGNDVWIGERSIILPGVNIGNGCIIGAGSVVTKSIQPYTLSAGNPCKVIRKRFSEEEIVKLEEMKWWDWSDFFIFDSIQLLQSNQVDALYEKYKTYLKENI